MSPSELRFGRESSKLPFLGTGVIYGIFTSRYTREGTAALPYAEDLFQKRHHWSRTGPHNRRVVTAGEIGTNALHPSREWLTRHREPDINTTSKRFVFQCGRAQRPSPTQRIFFDKQSIGAVNRFSISSTARTNVAARRRVGHLPRWSKQTDRYQTTQSLHS